MRWRIALFGAVGLMFAGDAPSSIAEPAAIQVPYRLTATKHILVRAKINGRGPYNLVLDTGAPVIVLARKLAEPLGITPDAGQWADLKRLEFEGGVVMENVAMRFDDLYQLEGMNGLGLAGAEIHGLVGYPVLARFRIEYDFTKTKLAWTPLAAKPDELARRPGGEMGTGGLQALGAVMKGLGKFLGADQLAASKPRGFAGMSLDVENEQLRVTNVVVAAPADRAGLRVGDIIRQANGRDVTTIEMFGTALATLPPGQALSLHIVRGDVERDINIELSEGF